MNDYSIYVHIPFCCSKCYYCDFCSFVDNQKNIDNYFVLSVITSVLTIICGIVLIINPSISAVMITTMIGIVVLVYAVFDIVDAFILKHRVKEISKYFEQLLK